MRVVVRVNVCLWSWWFGSTVGRAAVGEQEEKEEEEEEEGRVTKLRRRLLRKEDINTR